MRYAKICNVKKPSYLNSDYWHKDRIIRKNCNKDANYSIYTKKYLKKSSFCKWQSIRLVSPVIIIFYYSKFWRAQKLVSFSKKRIKHCYSIIDRHASRVDYQIKVRKRL